MNSKYKLVTITMTIGALFTAALVSIITPNVWTHAQFADEGGNNTNTTITAQDKLDKLKAQFADKLKAQFADEGGNNTNTTITAQDKLDNLKDKLNELKGSGGIPEGEDSGTAEIVLLSQKLKKSSSYHNLVGQVKNIGNDTAQYVRIDVTIYDKNGDVIGTDFGFATAKTLKPNQKSSFDLLSDDFKAMDHYEISLQWRNPDFSEGYTENAQIYKTNKTNTGSSDSN